MGNSRHAQLIQERLDALEWNRERLAEKSDIPKATLSRIMNGGTLTAKNALKLASVVEMKLTMSELFAPDERGASHGHRLSSTNREVAMNLYDQLPPDGQEMAIEYLVMLAKREQNRERGHSKKIIMLSKRSTFTFLAYSATPENIQRVIAFMRVIHQRAGRVWVTLDHPITGMPPHIIGVQS